VVKNYNMLKKNLNKQKKNPPQIPLTLSGKYQQVSFDPKALTNEPQPLQQQASNGPYQLDCMRAQMST
jgi:hypothetical protein